MITAVYYHADAQPLWAAPPHAYEQLAEGFAENVRAHVDDIVHLTITGFPGWGTRNVYYVGLDPAHVMLNREICFQRFLADEKVGAERVYWFTEPDARINEAIPELDEDLDGALLWRDDDVHITPSFRLLRKAAWPLLKWTQDNFDRSRQDWHGDSAAFNALYEEMGRPRLGRFEWRGLRLELRNYEDYTGRSSRYVRHWKHQTKRELLEQEAPLSLP